MATHVYYYLPSDRDDVEHPNVFLLSKPSEEVTLADLKAYFPLPGKYHFRCKVKLDGAAYYWLDCVDDNGVVPAVSSRRIVCKVLRLEWKADTTAVTAVRQAAPEQKQVNAIPQVVPVDHMDLFGSSNHDMHQRRPSNVNQAPTRHVESLDLFS